MTNEQILKKAIEKAWQNGYNPDRDITENTFYVDEDTLEHVNDIIFSHDFAKAFWGRDEHKGNNYLDCVKCGLYFKNGINNCWQYHLQQMVLEENPIKYLEKFL